MKTLLIAAAVTTATLATVALAATVKVLNEHDAGEPIDYTN